MSDLYDPLITKPDNTIIPQDSSTKVLPTIEKSKPTTISKINKQKSLKQGFESIKNSVFSSFSSTKLDFFQEVSTTKVSLVHSLIIGTSSNSNEVLLLSIKNPSDIKKIPTIAKTITSLKLSIDESQVFLSDNQGHIFLYSFPGFSSVKIFEIGKGKIIFGFIKSFLYTVSSDSIYIKSINIETKETKIIGRCENVTSIKITKDHKYVAVCNSQKVIVYSRDHQWSEFILFINETESFNRKMCGIEFNDSGDWLGISYGNLINIWKVGTWEKLKTCELRTKSGVSSFFFSFDNDWVVAAGTDHSINAWRVESYDLFPNFFNQSEENFKISCEFVDLNVDENKNLIYTHEKNSGIVFVWKGVFVDKIKYPESSFYKGSQRMLTCIKNNDLIVSDKLNHQFLIWDIESMNLLKIISIPGVPWELTFNGQNEEFLYVGSDNIIHVYSTADYSLLKSLINTWAGCIYAMRCSALYVVSGGTSNSIVIQNHDGALITEIKKHKEYVTGMKIHKEYLITGDFEGIIYIHILDTWAEYAKLVQHNNWIRSIEVCSNGDTMITVGRDKLCIFWSIYDKTHVKIKELEGDSDTYYLTKDEKNFVICTNNEDIFVFNLPSFEKIISLKYRAGLKQRFIVDKDEKYFIVSNNNGIFRCLSPISLGNPTIIANSIHVPLIKEFLNGKRQSQSDSLDNWIIAPYMINPLHYYSYENSRQELKEAIINGLLYLNSNLGTPLDLSIIKGNSESISTIVNELKRRVLKNYHALETLSDSLVELNKGGFRGLDELYNACLIFSPQKDLPTTCSEEVLLPQTCFALTLKITPETFLGSNFVDGFKKINFLVSTIRMNLEIGSSESITFLESLLECSNTRIFKTKFIQTVLNDKWKRVRWILLWNAWLLGAYLLFLSAHILINDQVSLILCLLSNICLFVYESLQIYIDPRNYVKDLWNFLDFTRILLFFTYFCYYKMITFDTQADISEILLITLTILSWVRGITLFRLHSSTRYMIGLLREVVIDIIPFSLVVFYSIIAFSFITLSSQNDRNFDPENFFFIVLKAYLDAIGGFDTDSKDLIGNFLIVLTTLFNCIIMMNLLISILGNTYARVNDEAQVEDLKQLISMIIECESFYITRRNNKNKTILQICEEYKPLEFNPEIDIKNRFKGLKSEIETLNSKFSDLQKNFQKISLEIREKQEETITKQENYKKEIIIELKNLIEESKRPELPNINENRLLNIKDLELNVCLNGHSTRLDKIFDKFCFICWKNLNNIDCLVCSICDFHICEECAKFNVQHISIKTGITCYLGHVLLYFQDFKAMIEEKQYENEICRLCSKEIHNTGFHCIVCLYSVCNKCKEIHDESLISNEKAYCRKQHALKWKLKEFYAGKESLIMTCSNCRVARLGAGYYACLECPYYCCIMCYERDYLQKIGRTGSNLLKEI